MFAVSRLNERVSCEVAAIGVENLVYNSSDGTEV